MARSKALAVTSDCTPRYVQANPYEGGKQAVAEAWRNLTAVGAEPIAITDNLNFGSPEKPETMGQIVRAIDGMAEACRALDFPVVSGNVSLYNETNGVSIPPTPTVGAVGLLKDYDQRVGFNKVQPGQVIILIGETKGEMGSSLYLREVFGLEKGAPPKVDLALRKEQRHPGAPPDQVGRRQGRSRPFRWRPAVGGGRCCPGLEDRPETEEPNRSRPIISSVSPRIRRVT